MSFSTGNHPCTWLFLDDEMRFLDALSLMLPNNQPTYMSDVPAKVLQRVGNGLLGQKSSNWSSSQTIGDLEDVEQILIDVNRFSTPAVLVVDYAMPRVNGLDFCLQIDNSQVRKVLLTGVADEHVALEAMNAGIIDRYIKKSDASAFEKIVRYARELSSEVLQEMYPIKSLEQELANAIAVVFQSNQFKEYLLERAVCEYYLCQNPLGIIGLDVEGTASFFALKLDYDAPPVLDEYTPLSILHIAQDRKIITGLFEELPRTEPEAKNYDWEFNTVVLDEIVPNEISFGVHDNPPLGIDYTPASHSLHRYLKEHSKRTA